MLLTGRNQPRNVWLELSATASRTTSRTDGSIVATTAGVAASSLKSSLDTGESGGRPAARSPEWVAAMADEICRKTGK